jgi:phosphocarrier protein
MTEREFEIVNRLGLHARAAAKLVTLAAGFGSDIHIRRNDQTVNGKSIMGVMLLAASKGTRITIIADGEDEEEAVHQLGDLINRRFGEPE